METQHVFQPFDRQQFLGTLTQSLNDWQTNRTKYVFNKHGHIK